MPCHFIPFFFLTFFHGFGYPDTTVAFSLIHALPSKLKESSGLCYTDGSLWTFCDSGNPPELYKIDSASGNIVQTVIISNYPNIDWEDMTADSEYLYIGDFGNNHGNRKDLRVLRISKSNLRSAAPLIRINAESISFSYSDQLVFTAKSKTDFDCESMISVGNQLYLFSKDGIDLKTRCYKLSKQPGRYIISAVSSFDSKGKITAACYNPETREISLLGYQNRKINSFIWFLSSYSGDQFFSGIKARVVIGNGMDWQTEGLTYISNKKLMMTCEGSPGHVAALYLITR